MNYFIMKARTLSDEWYEFSLADIPTLQNREQFVLMSKPGAPILSNQRLLRGDREFGVFEGDVVKALGRLWLICYERGFHAINTDYSIKHLYQLGEFDKVGYCTEFMGLPPITFKRRFLFKYKEQIFRLEDIVGAYDGKLLLRSVSAPVDASEIQQDCGVRCGGPLLYLGDEVKESSIRLAGGRIVIDGGNGKLIDIATGGVLDGYIPRAAG